MEKSSLEWQALAALIRAAASPAELLDFANLLADPHRCQMLANQLRQVHAVAMPTVRDSKVRVDLGHADIAHIADRLEALLRVRAGLTNAEIVNWLEKRIKTIVRNRKSGLNEILTDVLRTTSTDARRRLLEEALRLVEQKQPGLEIEGWWDEHDKRRRR